MESKVRTCKAIEDGFIIPWYYNKGEKVTLPNNVLNLPDDIWDSDYIKKYIVSSEAFKRGMSSNIFIHDIAIEEPEGSVYGDLYLDMNRVLCKVKRISHEGLTVSIKGCSRGDLLKRVIRTNPEIVRIGCCFIPDFKQNTIIWNKFTINMRYPNDSI